MTPAVNMAPRFTSVWQASAAPCATVNRIISIADGFLPVIPQVSGQRKGCQVEVHVGESAARWSPVCPGHQRQRPPTRRSPPASVQPGQPPVPGRLRQQHGHAQLPHGDTGQAPSRHRGACAHESQHVPATQDEPCITVSRGRNATKRRCVHPHGYHAHG